MAFRGVLCFHKGSVKYVTVSSLLSWHTGQSLAGRCSSAEIQMSNHYSSKSVTGRYTAIWLRYTHFTLPHLLVMLVTLVWISIISFSYQILLWNIIQFYLKASKQWFHLTFSIDFARSFTADSFHPFCSFVLYSLFTLNFCPSCDIRVLL